MMKISIIAAISADGFIAKEKNEPSTNWTSHEDKEHFVKLTKEIGTIVMGLNTFKTIGKPLPDRRNIILTNETISDVETFNGSPAELIKKLENEGTMEIAICGGQYVYNSFLQTGLVNKIYLTIEPIIFGQGLNLFSDNFIGKLELIKTENKNGTIFNEYKIIN